MKVLACQDETVVLEATRDEVMNLIGYHSRFSGGTPALKPGMGIAVHPMYRRLYDLSLARRQLAEAKAKLLGCAALLDEVEPIIPAEEKPL